MIIHKLSHSVTKGQLISKYIFGVFLHFPQKTNQNNSKICKKSSSFGIDFSSKIMTFSGSKSAWIFGWFFHWKWPPKVSHFQWTTIQKTRRFPSLSKIVLFALLERSGTVPDDRIDFATSTFHRFYINFGTHFRGFWTILDAIYVIS